MMVMYDGNAWNAATQGWVLAGRATSLTMARQLCNGYMHLALECGTSASGPEVPTAL